MSHEKNAVFCACRPSPVPDCPARHCGGRRLYFAGRKRNRPDPVSGRMRSRRRVHQRGQPALPRGFRGRGGQNGAAGAIGRGRHAGCELAGNGTEPCCKRHKQQEDRPLLHSQRRKLHRGRRHRKRRGTRRHLRRGGGVRRRAGGTGGIRHLERRHPPSA